jgi:putative peptidoglycan lipid II flippase
MLRSARTVSGLTLLSRVLGLLRDSATAALLGSTWVNDALNYAWTLPNLFRRLFGEGALSSAFVPVVSRVVELEGTARARDVANAVISAMAVFLVLLTTALIALVGLLPPERVVVWFGVADVARAAVLVRYIQIVLPYLAGACIVAQFMAVLNVLGEFTVPALAQVIVNLVWIAGVGVAAWWAPGEPPVQGEIIAWCVIVSAVLQFLWHLPRLRALGVGFRFVRPRMTPELSAVLRAMLPIMVGMGAGQIAVLADSHIAMLFLGEGGRTHVYYGMRVMQFPMGLVAVALGTVVYPLLARLIARGRNEEAAASADLALRTDLLLTLPAAVGLAVLARPIVGLLFQHGEFGPQAGDLTARALEGYALGIPAAGAVILLTRASYALGNTALPVRVGVAMVSVNVVLDLVLVQVWGEFGLGLATSVSATVSSLALLVGLRGLLGGVRSRALAPLLPLLACTALMGALVWAADAWLAGRTGAGTAGNLLRVAAGIGLGLAVFALSASRLCREEWRAVAALWSRRGAGPAA